MFLVLLGSSTENGNQPCELETIDEELKELAQKEEDLQGQERKNSVFSELTPDIGRRPRHRLISTKAQMTNNTMFAFVAFGEFLIKIVEVDRVRYIISKIRYRCIHGRSTSNTQKD